MRTEDGYFISKCLNGDPAAFGFLVDKYKACVYALAYTRLRNFHDAEDATQEVFLKAYHKLGTLKRYDNFRAWLYAITSNYCKMHFRSQKNRIDRDFIEDNPSSVLDDHSIELQRESLADEMNNELMKMLDEALESLPEVYHQVVTLRYLGGMSNDEIAEFLGISKTAIRQRLTRARAELKEGMLAMMNKAFEQKSLPASFTFHIIEIVKQIKIQPISLTKGLSLGLSLATGLMIVFLGIGQHINLSEPMGIFTASRLSGEAKVSEIGEFPVDITDISKVPTLSSLSGNGDGIGSIVPSLQNALFMAPQVEGGTWTKKADMPTDRTQLSISDVNGKIYVIGGDSKAGISSAVEEYDPIANKWIRKADMPTPRYLLAASVLNGKIYAIGGEKRDAPFSTVEEYDPITDKWTKKASLSLPRTCLSACTANGKIYAIGGMAARDNWLSADVEEYDPIADKWSKKADMPTPRMCLCTVVLKDKIYAIGGLPNKWPPISVVEEYNPISDTWIKKADMVAPRTYFTAVTMNEKIIVFGGAQDWTWPKDAVLATTIEEYDPITDKWIEKGNMPEPRMYCPASPVNGKIYVIGGLSAKNQIMTLVEEYDPNGIGERINFKGSIPTTWGDVRTASNR